MESILEQRAESGAVRRASLLLGGVVSVHMLSAEATMTVAADWLRNSLHHDFAKAPKGKAPKGREEDLKYLKYLKLQQHNRTQ